MTLPLVEPTDLPWTQRIWTCARCKKGLGYMSDSEKVRSAQAHLDKFSGLTISENYEQLKNANLIDFQQNHRNKAGWHNVAWRQKRIAETKAQGHEILYVGDFETGMQNATRLKYTCCAKDSKVVFPISSPLLVSLGIFRRAASGWS